MAKFKLTLENRIGEPTVSTTIELSQTGTPFTLIKDIECTCDVTMTEINYEMGMYVPDHFTAKLELSGDSIPATQVAKRLIGVRATASIGDTKISYNMFVYRVVPTLSKVKTDKEATTKVTLALDIYSADKLMELKKYSQTFTGQTLGSIINDRLPSFVANHTSSDGIGVTPKYSLTCNSNKQILDYKFDTTESNAHEAIQPYLVQYNETFRSMINRTANRCGEFLYWHNGQLQYGLHSSPKTTNVTKTAQDISMCVEPDSEFNEFSVVDSHRSGKAKYDENPAGLYNYDLETGMPDFNETINMSLGDRGYKGYCDKRMYGSIFGLKYNTDPTKDEYNSIDWEKSDSMTYVIGKFLSDYAKTGFFLDFVTDTMIDIAVNSYCKKLKDAEDADAKKQKINHKRFKSKDEGDKYKFNTQEQTNFSSDIDTDGSLKVEGSNYEECDTLENKNKIAPFSTLKAVVKSVKHDLFDEKVVLGNSFYSKIRNFGEMASQQAIDITMLSELYSFQIGDLILANGSTYLITSIQANCDLNGSTKYKYNIHAIPSVYSYNAKQFYLPEQLPEQNRQMDGNSTAIVTDNEDPFGQNRVRVRFTWQSKSETVVTAQMLQDCHYQALKDVYGKSDAENAKAYDDDKTSPIVKYKSDISNEIVKAKIDAQLEEGKELSDEDKKSIVPETDDKFHLYQYDGKLYSKTTALQKAGNDATKITEDSTEYKWSDILDKESNKQKVDTLKKSYEEEEKKNAELTEHKKDSTPWIRMASPMASKKAMVYMKPQVNDEVIIGFENGNPERPYVLGSLYNGTASAPSAPYTITGVNGETISMEDENMSAADIVGKLISPLAKTVLSKVVDPDAQNDKVAKKVVPVGGKITLKDKYGFYNLSMSSADRKIDIKSPLGDISISAFTGITLSAPNGDINIKGKNVNITAGDKITLTSGTNKDIYAWSPTELPGMITKMAYSIATNAMKTFVGDYKIVDLSMFRSVWEVVFRPLNGTMLLHSKHHMMIQAGNGNAELPVDAIKATDAHHAIDVFPNYPFFLLKQIVKSFEDKYIGKLISVQKNINTIQSAVKDAREPIDAIDGENQPTQAQAIEVAHQHAGEPGYDVSKLSKTIVQFILKYDYSNVEMFTNSDLKGKCPFPVEDPDSINNWYAKVWGMTYTVLSLSQLSEDLTSLLDKFKKSPAVESAVKALNNDYIIKKAWGNSNKIKVEDLFEGIDPKNIQKSVDNNISNFKAEDYVGSKANLAIYEKATTLLIDRIQFRFAYNIVKVLHQQGVVKYLADKEEYKVGMKNYKLADLPTWDETKQWVSGFDANDEGKEKFIQRVVPASWVSSSEVGGMITTALKDTANTVLNDLIDFKDFNWMFHQERNLWDTTTHPGLIMMSDEKGTTTTTLNINGKFEVTDNTTVNSVLSAMGRKASQVATSEEKVQNAHSLHVRKRDGFKNIFDDSLGISGVRPPKKD